MSHILLLHNTLVIDFYVLLIIHVVCIVYKQRFAQYCIGIGRRQIIIEVIKRNKLHNDGDILLKVNISK